MEAVYCFHFPFHKKYAILVKRKVITLKYTDLIFDLYGTLVDIHTEENAAVWKRTSIYYGFYGAGYTAKELQAAFQASMAQRQANAGQSYECFPDLPCEESFAQLFRDKGVTENADTLGFQAAQLFRILSIDYIKPYNDAKDALKRLRKKGYRLWLLSNAQRAFTAYEPRYLQLDTLFDGIYISSDYGCRKPDQHFFRALLEDQGLNISKCLMIGNDRDTDIAGAKAIGLDTLYMQTNITPPGQKAADPSMHPGANTNATHYEYEGSNWSELVNYILRL